MCVAENIHSKEVRNSCEEDLTLLEELLGEIEQQFSNQTLLFGVPLWPTTLSAEVISHYEKIDSINYISENLPVFHPSISVSIMRVVFEVADETFNMTDEVVKNLEDNEDECVSVCAELLWSDSEFSDNDIAGAEDESDFV